MRAIVEIVGVLSVEARILAGGAEQQDVPQEIMHGSRGQYRRLSSSQPPGGLGQMATCMINQGLRDLAGYFALSRL